MTVGLSKPAALAVALACALVGGVARADTPASTAKRVIVFDLQSDVSGQEVAQLPDLIEQLVASHAGYVAVPDAEMHQALSKVSAKRPDCSVMDTCRKQVASEVRADLIVSGSFARQGKEFILYLALDEAKGTTTPTRTSERMKKIKSLQSNMKLCLERLFAWPPGASVASSRSASLPPSEPIPPIPVPSSVPASPPDDSPAPAPGKLHERPAHQSLALIATTGGQGLTPSQLQTFQEVLLNALDATGRFKVTGQADIDALLSLEARKQATGCKEDTGCMVAIAGALGVDLVATTDIGRLDKTTVVSINVIDVRFASVVARAQQTFQSDDALPEAADAMAAHVVSLIWPDQPVLSRRSGSVGTTVPEVESTPRVDLHAVPEAPAPAPEVHSAGGDNESSSGGITAAAVGEIIQSHWGEIKLCYEQQLVKDPTLAGEIGVHFQIGPEGGVVHPRVRKPAEVPKDNVTRQLHNLIVEECMLTNVREWKFPKPRGGGFVDVNYPFVFTSGE